LPALGLLDQVQIGDTGPAESTRRGNLQRVGLLFLGSRDNTFTVGDGISGMATSYLGIKCTKPSVTHYNGTRIYKNMIITNE
jgi:hypothetical protein